MNNKMNAYLIGVIVGGLIGVVLYFIQPVRWEGQALVKLGSLLVKGSQKTTSSIGLENSSIEEMQVVIERLKSPSFVQTVVKKLENNRASELIYNKGGLGFKTRSIRNSDSLVIGLTGDSPDIVRSALGAIVEELLSIHEGIYSEAVNSIQSEIAGLETEVGLISRRLNILIDGGASEGENSVNDKSRVSGFAVLIMLHDLDIKNDQLRTLREHISILYSKSTRLAQPISISEWRMFNNIWHACVIGVFFGVFVSFIWLVWKARKASPPV
ncbi:hypothetical protein RP726_03050 [Candidatus Methylospira mobilis]|uniref:hypothetical protein n=1 Tax=Candidatus Methylospira mobilis TaxID=1808979 RepID=UPI0028E7392D|nr:hypothetical protein [Candidatus Methylospira mobilis]WNV05399.1 hypothetical protein RP726_03050 [Candidatus Methylospira mobilis]